MTTPICEDFCPFECEKTNFDQEISYSGFPSRNYYYDSIHTKKSYWEGIFCSTTYNTFKNSIVPVSIYFDELTITTIKETVSLSFVGLVANIGGTLGLFIGVSMLTFTEVLVLLIDVGLIEFFKKSASNRVDVRTSFNKP